MMGVFAFQHKGHFLPGFALIIAPSESDARDILRDNLQRSPLYASSDLKVDDADIVLIGALDADKPGMIEVWNGDY